MCQKAESDGQSWVWVNHLKAKGKCDVTGRGSRLLWDIQTPESLARALSTGAAPERYPGKQPAHTGCDTTPMPPLPSGQGSNSTKPASVQPRTVNNTLSLPWTPGILMDCLVGQKGWAGGWPGQKNVSLTGFRLSKEHCQAPQKQTSCKRETKCFSS